MYLELLSKHLYRDPLSLKDWLKWNKDLLSVCVFNFTYYVLNALKMKSLINFKIKTDLTSWYHSYFQSFLLMSCFTRFDLYFPDSYARYRWTKRINLLRTITLKSLLLCWKKQTVFWPPTRWLIRYGRLEVTFLLRTVKWRSVKYNLIIKQITLQNS
jgi:hypothetical protein